MMKGFCPYSTFQYFQLIWIVEVFGVFWFWFCNMTLGLSDIMAPRRGVGCITLGWFPHQQLHHWARVVRKLRSLLVVIMFFLIKIFSDFHLPHWAYLCWACWFWKVYHDQLQVFHCSTSGLWSNHINLSFGLLSSKSLSVRSQQWPMA